MKRALLGLLVVCCTMGLASVALAGDNDIAGISFHVTKPTQKAANCNDLPSFNNGPASIDSRGQSCPQGVGDFDVWVLVCNGSDSVGVGGVEFGIDYDGALGSGVDINTWRNCGFLQFPSDTWPEAGSGNIVTWAACQNTSSIPNDVDENGNIIFNHMVIAVAGVFNITAYGKDVLYSTPRPVTGLAKVASCAAVEDDITPPAGRIGQLGNAGFCKNVKGYNYCVRLDRQRLGTEDTTWGKIKSQY